MNTDKQYNPIELSKEYLKKSTLDNQVSIEQGFNVELYEVSNNLAFIKNFGNIAVFKNDTTGLLIDTGMGPGPYDHTDTGGQFLSNLSKLGKQPEDIDFVYTTHTHGDHMGWNITWKNDVPVKTFPNAKYLVSKFDFDYYSENPNDDFNNQILPLKDLGGLELVEGRTCLLYTSPSPRDS